MANIGTIKKATRKVDTAIRKAEKKLSIKREAEKAARELEGKRKKLQQLKKK